MGIPQQQTVDNLVFTTSNSPKTIKNQTILSLVLEMFQFLSVGRLHDKKKSRYQNILETSSIVDMDYVRTELVLGTNPGTNWS